MKEMTEQFPPEVSDGEKFRDMLTQAEQFLKENSISETSSVPSNFESEQQNAPVSNNGTYKLKEHMIEENNEAAGITTSQDGGNVPQESNGSSLSNAEAVNPSQSFENDSKSANSSRPGKEGETQVIEQFEPGVYITLIVKPDGVKVFKRVRFRYYSYF